MRENAILNKVKKKLQVRQGDAREIIMTELIGEADRVIMPLPEKAFEYLEAAVRALKPSGGIIHYYDFVHSSMRNDPRVSVKARVEEKLSQLAKEHSVRFSRVVRSVGPNWYQVVLDIDTVPLKG
jgi:tRNA (guanine37-N1)-methyltransferase